MNRTYTNDRPAHTGDGRAGAGRGGSGNGSQAPRRTGAPVRSGGYGRRPAAIPRPWSDRSPLFSL